jgi:hypothetical protein
MRLMDGSLNIGGIAGIIVVIACGIAVLFLIKKLRADLKKEFGSKK